MPKPKIISLVFSDIHINLWSSFNTDNKRTLNSLGVLHLIKARAEALDVPVLFTGDLFHKPSNIDNELLEIFLENTKDMGTLKVYAISGNHDQSSQNSYSKRSPSYVRSMSIKCDWLEEVDFKVIKFKHQKFIIYGIPYITGNQDMSKALSDMISEMNHSRKKYPDYKHILMLHTDYPGAKDTDGTSVDSVENLNINLLHKFDLVLIGHIHKPQRMSKKVYMVGATNQQRRTDRDCDLGYWEIYDDMSMKFKPLPLPRFIDVENEEDKMDDGNYYTIIPKKLELKEVKANKVQLGLSKTKLARRYLSQIAEKDKAKKRLLISILNKCDE